MSQLAIDFLSKANGNLPGTFDTGQTLTEAGAEDGFVSGGAYTFNPTSGTNRASYASFELPTNVTRMRMAFEVAGAGAVAMAVTKTLVSGSNPSPPTMPLHFSASKDTYQVGYWDGPDGGNTGLHDYMSGTWNEFGGSPLATTGKTVNTIEAFVDNNTVAIFLPNGSSRTYTDSNIGSRAGRFGFFELFNAVGTDAPAKIIDCKAWDGSQPLPLNRPWNVFVRNTTASTTYLTANTAETLGGIISPPFIAPASGVVEVHWSAFLHVPTAADLYFLSYPVLEGTTWGTPLTTNVNSGTGAHTRSVTHILSGLTPGLWYRVVPQIVSTASDTDVQVFPAAGMNQMLSAEPVLGSA